MARINRTFTISRTAQEAQAMFMRDIAPELHRAGGFTLTRQAAGRLAFSDGIVDAMGLPTKDSGLYSMLRRLMAHRVTVHLLQEPTGTTVTVRGNVTGAIRDALKLLGEPGHWPATARPPTEPPAR